MADLSALAAARAATEEALRQAVIIGEIQGPEPRALSDQDTRRLADADRAYARALADARHHLRRYLGATGD